MLDRVYPPGVEHYVINPYNPVSKNTRSSMQKMMDELDENSDAYSNPLSGSQTLATFGDVKPSLDSEPLQGDDDDLDDFIKSYRNSSFCKWQKLMQERAGFR